MLLLHKKRGTIVIGQRTVSAGRRTNKQTDGRTDKLRFELLLRFSGCFRAPTSQPSNGLLPLKRRLEEANGILTCVFLQFHSIKWSKYDLGRRATKELKSSTAKEEKSLKSTSLDAMRWISHVNFESQSRS